MIEPMLGVGIFIVLAMMFVILVAFTFGEK